MDQRARPHLRRAGGVPERVPLTLTDAAVRDLVERMLHATGRRVDLSQPFVDASLPDGSRLHVVIPTSPAATGRSMSASSCRRTATSTDW